MADLTQYSKTNTPSWMQIGYLRKFIIALSSVLNDHIDRAKQAVKIRFPGVVDSSSLSAIGNERRYPRTLADTNTTYATRLRTWLDFHPYRGNAKALLAAVREHYLPTEMDIRLYERNGAMRRLNSGSYSITYPGINIGGPSNRWAYCALVLFSDSVPFSTQDQIADLRLVPAMFVPAHIIFTIVIVPTGAKFFDALVTATDTWNTGTTFDDAVTGYTTELS